MIRRDLHDVVNPNVMSKKVSHMTFWPAASSRSEKVAWLMNERLINFA